MGAGYMAHEHARAFAALPNVEIVGICGRSHSRANIFSMTYSVPVFDNIRQLYENTLADVVIVAVNELSIRQVCLEVFDYPWLSFLEKPVGLNLLEAKEIEAKANSKGAKSYVALNRRSYSSTRLALQKLSEDDAPRLISVLDQQDMCAALESGQPERVVENYMYANSIHLIDYFHIFGRGEIIEISSFQKWNPENPCYVVSSIRFSSGDIGVYQAVWKGPGPWSVSVTNPNVRIEMRPLEKFSIQNKGERKLNEVQIESSETEYKPGLIFQAKQIVNLLDGLPSTLATLKDSMRTMELCSKIYNKE